MAFLSPPQVKSNLKGYVKLVALLIVLLHDAATAMQSSECHTGGNGGIEIVNVTVAIILTMSDQPEDASTSLIMQYSWNAVNDDEIQYDGFLYKLDAMRDAASMFLQDDDYDSVDAICDITSQRELWTIGNNGTAIRCKMPCTPYFPNISSSCFEGDSVCSLRNEDGFYPLPADARNISIGASFGEKYVFRLYAYQHWMVVERYDEKDEITIFCQDELIDRRGLNISEAKYYCRNISMASDPTLISGPPASFQNYSVSYNLASNRGEIIFRWKEPYDVSTPISKYAVAVRPSGEYEDGLIGNDERSEDSFFYFTISKIRIGEEHTVKVTPSNDESKTGLAYQANFIIPEINACLHPHRYCARDADCVDLLGVNETAAICTCGVGYEGNGINSSFAEGEGCTDFDACRLTVVCNENAKCVDKPPPSMEAECTCGAGYFGDGRSSGSGCRKVSSVVLLASVVPMGLLSFFLMYLCLKRVKYMKQRSHKLSKFLASSSAKYMAPFEYFNENIPRSSAVFGKKLELDRDMIDLNDVLGRGNFGVVYKGTLKTNSGKLEIAVKTTAEPHSHEMESEFLAEIALLISLGQHENILNMIGCCTSGIAPVYLVTPLMKYGDLLHFLWDCREESNRARDQIYILKEGNIYDIAKQVANGLEYVTGLRIIHGDIAARNILVDEKLKCKISDFGLANDVYLYGAVKGAREKRVPIRWISPERMQEGRVTITWRSDVWSFGMLLYEMSTLGATPFADVPTRDLFKRLISGYRMSQPPSCSQFLYHLMTRCWEWVPSKRPSFKEIKQIMIEAECNGSNHYENMIQDV